MKKEDLVAGTTIINNHVYQGGNPSDDKNWAEVGQVVNGFRFRGGLRSDEKSWVPKDTPEGPAFSAQQGMKALGKAIGYPSGIINTGLATAASMGKQAVKAAPELAKGNIKSAWDTFNQPAVSSEEIKTALNPFTYQQAPSLATYAERLGIPAGPEVGLPETGRRGLNVLLPEKYNLKPGAFKVPLRDVGSGLASAYFDPLNKFLPKPIEDAGVAAAEKVYSLPFKKQDMASKLANKTPYSNVLFRNKISGTPEDIFKGVEGAINKYGKIKNQIFDSINEAGITGDVESAVKKGRDFAESLANSRISEDAEIGKRLISEIDQKYAPLFQREAQNIVTPAQSKIIPVQRSAEDILSGSPATQEITIPGKQETIPGVSGATPEEINSLRQHAATGLTPNELSGMTPTQLNKYNQGKKIIGSGLKEEGQNMASQVSPELENQFVNTNNDMSTLLSLKKKAQSQAQSSSNNFPIRPGDVITGAVAAGASHNPLVAAGAVGLKKIIEAMKSTYVPTVGGLALEKAAQNIPFDAWLRQSLATKPSSWQNVNEEKQ